MGLRELNEVRQGLGTSAPGRTENAGGLLRRGELGLGQIQLREREPVGDEPVEVRADRGRGTSRGPLRGRGRSQRTEEPVFEGDFRGVVKCEEGLTYIEGAGQSAGTGGRRPVGFEGPDG